MDNHPKHILAVDDNEGVRDVMALLLRDQGYRVTTADGGVSMREILQKDGAIDAVILDALMPGEGSERLALHARDLGIPVVMVSGSPDRIEFAEEHGLQLLRKPFRSEQLIGALKLAFDSGVAGQRSHASATQTDRTPTVARCLERAAECERLAGGAATSDNGKMLVDVAAQWRSIAAQKRETI